MTVQPASAAPLMPSSITQYVADYHALSELMRVAVRTDFVPKAFRPEAFIPRENRNPTQQQLAEAFEKSVASATIGAHFGMSIGVGSDPFSALQNVHVVNGKPGLYTEAAVSLVQSRGHDVWTEDLTDSRAIVCGRRAGSDHVERVVITMDQAKRAGWTRNATYQSTPQDMLYARAASRVCRRVAADALKGIGFAEELQDDEAGAAPAGNGTRTVQRAATRAVTGSVERPAPTGQAPATEAPTGPPLPGEDGETQPAAVTLNGPGGPSAGPMDEATWRKINARFVQLGRGVNGPGQQNARLYVIGRIVDRTVARGSDLNAAEGDLLLSTLQGTTSERIDALLAERNRVEPGEQREVAAGPPLPDEQPGQTGYTEPGDGDEVLGDDVPEPGEDEGRPAALEGVVDPWAGQ